MQEAPIAVGSAAPNQVLRDHADREVALASLWQQQAVVLVFLRHFGCPHCRAFAVQLRHHQPQFAAAQLGVALIGLGTPEKASAFRGALKLPFTVLCDPEKKSYHQYGLLTMNPVRDFATPTVMAQYAANTVRFGFKLAPTAAEFMQLGGDFVVDHAGIIRLAFRSLRSSDHPKIADLLATVAPTT